jgi:D-3-phosphoglycerate dehydrogenase
MLGDAGINIATFALGRATQGGDAIALVQIDGTAPDEVIERVRALPMVRQAKPLAF